jgi:hypothetical protein
LGHLPYALYAQYIGEDESSYLPAKYLAQLGAEGWKPLGDGGMVQFFAEYSSTTCSANTNRGPYYDCAYNQGRFNIEGYRYRGRVLGHTADADAEIYSAGATYVTAGGDTWSATARNALLNRASAAWRNTVTPVRADYSALELGWRGRVFGEPISVDLGVESIQPDGADREVEPYGFVRWTHEFAP